MARGMTKDERLARMEAAWGRYVALSEDLHRDVYPHLHGALSVQLEMGSCISAQDILRAIETAITAAEEEREVRRG